jgi:methionine-rich copper-binding protein CopC
MAPAADPSRTFDMKQIAAFLAAASALLMASSAHAHAHLESASPAAGSTVATAPSEVTLSFSEKLEPAFSRLEVRNAQGARVDQAPATINGNTISAPLKPVPPGRYTVRWRVLSVDTHKTEGSFTFQVGR